ncbi:uncharacterized protein LOC105847659 isoform X1 [Hydra vulgaris]|uniref:uncharacterized protein LOC105847659 isoform X1 n=1 Tax=Hydra vulgaris TaxID=6087 RepID=UPI0032EA6942
MVLVTIEDLKLMFPKLGDFLKIKSVFLAIYSKDIDSMLKDHPKGASILSEYERTGQLVLMKDLFVRIIVKNLVKDSNCYSNTEKKKALALEAINRFPTLRSGNGDGYKYTQQQTVSGWAGSFSRILLYAKGKRKGLSTDLTILLDEIAANNNLLEDTKEEYALLLLPLMLTVPMRNRQRASVAEVCKRFIQLHPYGTSMDEILSKIKSDSIKQPIIIALGVTGNISQSFIVVENEVIESRCMVSAVDKCFKLHYIGQIEYDQSVSHVWQFLQVHFYGILDNVPISECVRDLVTFLKAR